MQPAEASLRSDSRLVDGYVQIWKSRQSKSSRPGHAWNALYTGCFLLERRDNRYAYRATGQRMERLSIQAAKERSNHLPGQVVDQRALALEVGIAFDNRDHAEIFERRRGT